MKSYTGLSNIQKFIVSLSVIFLIALVDYMSFSAKSRQIEMYDDLSYRLSAVRVSISKLEYILDMFVVARRFEETTVEMINNDVDKLDENINVVLNERHYAQILSTNTKLAEGMSSIAADWQTIKTEVRRLNSTLSQEEIILLHNAVDVNTLLATEKTDQLLSTVMDSRTALFAETKSQAVRTVVGFVVLTLLVSAIFHKKILSPIDRARLAARRISAGDTHVRFHEDKLSSIGLFSAELNHMLDSVAESQRLKDYKLAGLTEESRLKTSQMESLSRLMASAGRSVSRSDLFNTAVKEAVLSGGADASALYLIEADALQLKASAGFDDNFMKEISTVPVSDLAALSPPGTRSFDLDDGTRAEGYWLLFKGRGYEKVICSPISSNNGTIGFLSSAFVSKADRDPVFFEALAFSAGALAGHISLFQEEHGIKKFLERVMNQMPFGVAVFDKNGACLMLNSVLKRYLGADNRFNLVGEYTIFKDDVFEGAGMLPSIMKSYEGYATEFIINYTPSLVKRYFFAGEPRRLRIKSFPLYDAGGEISNIMLLYEDLSGSSEETVKSSGP